MEKLAAGVASGKVRNASAYVVGVCNGPDVLGVDEEATKMLNELPLETRKAVIEKLRKTPDVRNPSAWVIRAVVSAKNSGRHQAVPPQMGGMSGVVLTLDPGARTLLQTLPQMVQSEILSRLMQQRDVKNPSAWVVKAAVDAGADTTGSAVEHGRSQPQVGGWQMLQPTRAPGPSASPSMALTRRLDDGARELLRSLPAPTQQELLSKLAAQSDIKNPSAWMVKAALAAGARANHKGSGEQFPAQVAVEQYGAQEVAEGHGLQDENEIELDAQAQALLSTISDEAQQEILQKLQNSINDGRVKNPSAWVVKAALKAGATSTPGAGQAAMAANMGGAWLGVRAFGQAPLATGRKRPSPY